MNEPTGKPSPSLPLLFLPSNGGLFLVLLLGLFLFKRPYGLLWDGGTSRHISTGLTVLRDHVLPTNNYLWAIDPSYHWQTNALLSEVIFGAFYSWWGLNGVVLCTSFALALALTWTFQLARARGLGFLLSSVGLIAVMYSSSIHWSARPHVFTYLPFLVMYFLVFCWRGAAKVRALAIFLSMIVWVNLHGSFYMGIVMLGAKLVGDWLSQLLHSDRTDDDPAALSRPNDSIKVNALAVGAGVLASCFNNRGPTFLTYVLEYMSMQVNRYTTDEWRSLDFGLGLPTWIFLLLGCLLIAAWTYSPRKPALPEFAFVLLLFIFSLYGMRIVPYFMMAALIAVGPPWRSWSASISDRVGVDWLKRLITIGQRFSAVEPNSYKLAGAWSLAALTMTTYWLYSPAFKISDYDSEKMPVQCSNYLRDKKIDGLGFHSDNWGGYLYWKLGKPVYIDDYHDFYPHEFVQEYAKIYFTNPGWRETLDARNFSWILIPSSIPLAAELKQDKRWKVVCEDQAGVLFLPATPEK
jgi:hypothetical protein